jgi:hypothetical protein
MLKIKLVILFLSSLFFLSTPVVAEELSCPDGGGAMQIQYGNVVNCSIESAGDLDVFAISATEGDFISANVNYTGDDDCTILQLQLRGLDDKNQQLAKSTAGACSGTRIEFTVAKTDIHTITIADLRNSQTGEYQVEFQCLSGPCTKLALLPKQECTATYDGSELIVPYIEFGSKVFFANFNLISSNPIQLQIIEGREK